MDQTKIRIVCFSKYSTHDSVSVNDSGYGENPNERSHLIHEIGTSIVGTWYQRLLIASAVRIFSFRINISVHVNWAKSWFVVAVGRSKTVQKTCDCVNLGE